MKTEYNFDRVVQILRTYYEKAKHLEYVHKPLSWALYQTWKHVDAREKSNTEDSKPYTGKWIRGRFANENTYIEVCSECGWVEINNIWPDKEKSLPYCPHCGSHNRPPKDRSNAEMTIKREMIEEGEF